MVIPVKVYLDFNSKDRCYRVKPNWVLFDVSLEPLANAIFAKQLTYYLPPRALFKGFLKADKIVCKRMYSVLGDTLSNFKDDTTGSCYIVFFEDMFLLKSDTGMIHMVLLLKDGNINVY